MNISSWTVGDWCSKDTTEPTRSASSYYDHNILKKEHRMQFPNSLNTMPSHICRKDTDKNYLERCFRSYADLYNQYKSQFEKEDMVTFDIKTFKQIFTSHPKKLSLFTRKRSIRCLHRAQEWKYGQGKVETSPS